MKAFFCIPSARPVAEVLPIVAAWKEQGYGVALQRDLFSTEDSWELRCANSIYWRPYQGYAEAVNYMAHEVLRDHPEVDWIVTGGDDTYPDPNKTGDEIAEELSEYFAGRGPSTPVDDKTVSMSIQQFNNSRTFAVMQCTGDSWADSQGRIIERIAGSPFLGREWCRRAWGGRGPLWPEFQHMFVDESLQLYAQSLGVFLQRPDLTHFHAHAQRDGKSKAPAHMAQWNTQKHWVESKAIFERLKSTNFAECQPIP